MQVSQERRHAPVIAVVVQTVEDFVLAAFVLAGHAALVDVVEHTSAVHRLCHAFQATNLKRASA